MVLWWLGVKINTYKNTLIEDKLYQLNVYDVYVMFLGDTIDKPKFCISVNTSDTGERILNVHRQNCSTKLEWFVCKKGKDILCYEMFTSQLGDSPLLYFNAPFSFAE